MRKEQQQVNRLRELTEDLIQNLCFHDMTDIELGHLDAVIEQLEWLSESTSVEA